MARTRESPFAKQMAAVPVTQPYSTHTNPLIAIEEYYHVHVCVISKVCVHGVWLEETARKQKKVCYFRC